MTTMQVKTVPAKRHRETRKFNGRLYHFVERNLNKVDAVRTRDSLRYRGNFVRIIQTKLGWEVWAYHKKKRI